MEISINGMKLLEEYEGRSLIVYKDSANLDTIGIGHLLLRRESNGVVNIYGIDVNYRNGLTDQQVDDLFKQDLEGYVEAVNRITTTLNQNQFDALVCFCFNVGVHAFLTSGVYKWIELGNFNEAINHWRQWNKSGGTIVQGLVNRRNKEINLFTTL